MFLGLIAQFGLILGQMNPDDFNEIAQVLFEHLRGVFRGMYSLGFFGNIIKYEYPNFVDSKHI